MTMPYQINGENQDLYYTLDEKVKQFKQKAWEKMIQKLDYVENKLRIVIGDLERNQ